MNLRKWLLVEIGPTLLTIARTVALFLGTFTAINLAGALVHPRFDASYWWVHLPAIPALLTAALMVGASATLLAFAFAPRLTRSRRILTGFITGLLLLAALVNTATFFRLQFSGRIAAGIPLPLSIFIASALALTLSAILALRPAPEGIKPLSTIFVLSLGCALAFPLCQMLFFGRTDYRRPADAAVVLGARAYADGTPSDALADRIRTACELYREGKVRKLIFSGGPGDGAVHETEAMRRVAIQSGVSERDILIDLHGFNTRATVANTLEIFAAHDFDRVLVVSHAFHLPRIKLTYLRAGFEVYTVPARESYFLRQMPYLMARETAAWWAYYLLPSTSPRQG